MPRFSRTHVAGTRSKSTAMARSGNMTISGSKSSTSTGRSVSQNVRVAAAKARVSADKKRGVTTEAWIVDLANKAS